MPARINTGYRDPVRAFEVCNAEKRSQTHSWLLAQILHDHCKEISRIFVHEHLVKIVVLFVIADLTRRERTHG